MTVSEKINAIATKSSWIRKMFEEGNRLKTLHGADKVFDFSLGNPNLLPPDAFKEVLKEVASDKGAVHSYMPNVGYPDTRAAVAVTVSKEQGVTLTENEIIMTCGAAGALNVIFKTVLNPGDEIISPVPHFVEYGFYADNHGGTLVKVPTNEDFTLDIKAIESEINPKTKIVLINSPNNPTGQIYSKESLDQLGALLREKNKEFNTTIYLVSDEPYRKVVYDNAVVPGIFESYDESIVATSYSKDISIPGERIGFLAVNPKAKYKDQIYGGFALSNRILGYVNAPALMQRVIAKVQGLSVDIDLYKRKRDLFCEGLKDAGYDFTVPPGAFYLFPKSPIADDVKFVQALQEELILTVPGSGFAGPGYFRIAYCVDDKSIENSISGFKKVMAKFS
ncbi:MAG: pyridoxal phosphate-dependent aminotransferase [Desulfobacterales bacterium]|nr:pyridoxal phosphate-dependent aminotransferase [Desulfobacterales bacterium]